MDGEFKVGNTFLLKPKGGTKVKIKIIQVELNRQFTDVPRFLGTKMVGSHEFVMHGDELEIKTTMSIDGWLSFLWRKLVAENVADGMKKQTKKLIEKASRA